MAHSSGADSRGDLRLDFDRRVRLEFRRSQLGSDGGLLIVRELDRALGLSDLASAALADTRTGANRVHRIAGLFPRVGFAVPHLSMEPEWINGFYNRRGTAEQHIHEGKYASRWTRRSCRRFRDNENRLQFHALAYNRAVFLSHVGLPELMAEWSLTSLHLKLIKISARVVRTPAPSPSSWLRPRSPAPWFARSSRQSNACGHLWPRHADSSYS